MQNLIAILENVEFWMGLSLVAAALPGPQTRVLPALFKAIAQAVSLYRNYRKTSRG